ncbi:MAG: hypothetical protein ACMUIA_10950, partial [bacterium]
VTSSGRSTGKIPKGKDWVFILKRWTIHKHPHGLLRSRESLMRFRARYQCLYRIFRMYSI